MLLYPFRWISVEVESLGMILTLVGLAILFERSRRGLTAEEAQGAREQIVYLQR